MALHEEEPKRLENREHNRSTTDTGIDDLALTSNWMRRTGWAGTFAGVDRRLLLALSQSPARDGCALDLGEYGSKTLCNPADDERRLIVIGRAIDRFFDRCEDTHGTPTTP